MQFEVDRSEFQHTRAARSSHQLLDTTDQWLTVEHRQGPDGIESVYRSLLEGHATPNHGYVVAMHKDARS